MKVPPKSTNWAQNTSFKEVFSACRAEKWLSKTSNYFLWVPTSTKVCNFRPPSLASRIADSIKADGGTERVAMFPRFNIEGCKLMFCARRTHSLSPSRLHKCSCLRQMWKWIGSALSENAPRAHTPHIDQSSGCPDKPEINICLRTP